MQGRRTAATLICLASSSSSTRLCPALAMTTTSRNGSSSSSSSSRVNLLDLASAAVACTVTASRSIRKISQPVGDSENSKNTRFKEDGSFVTDADFAAQGVIVQAIRSVSKDVRFVGEESEEEMATHIGQHVFLEDDILQRTRNEIWLRYHEKDTTVDRLPLAHTKSDDVTGKEESVTQEGLEVPSDCIVEASRVAVIVDPLDGTKSYAHHEYDCVSILIAIILDNKPCFGVIGKPFGYSGLPSILDTECAAVYGGPLIKGVYVAGDKAVKPTPIDASAAVEDLPRAVISGSRSKGVVQDFCLHLGEKGKSTLLSRSMKNSFLIPY